MQYVLECVRILLVVREFTSASNICCATYSTTKIGVMS